MKGNKLPCGNRPNGFLPSFDVPLVTFVTRRKLPPAAEARLKGKTQFINHGKFILLTYSSCRAGTPFRYTTKGGKGVSKERGKPFGAVSLSPLKSPLLSTDRGTPPHGKRAGSYVFEIVRQSPRRRAGTYFYCAVKVGKSALNEEKCNKVALGKPFRAVSPPIFGISHLFR